MRKLFIITSMIIFLLVAGIAGADNSVTFRWDANTEPDLAGYRLYQTTSEGVYTYGEGNQVAVISAGVETVTLETVPDGTFFWVLTAYDLQGNESGPSNEVSATLDSVAPGAPTILNITAIVKAP